MAGRLAGRLAGRYDWAKLRERARLIPIAADKRSEGKAILAGIRRILGEVDERPAGAVVRRSRDV